MKEKVLALRALGHGYGKIAEALGCTKGAVQWHCNAGYRKKWLVGQQQRRKAFTRRLKLDSGGKCSKCGYDRCLAALQFHHKDKGTKLRVKKDGINWLGVTALASTKNRKTAIAEAKKCVLLCANCHAEEHYGNEQICGKKSNTG